MAASDAVKLVGSLLSTRQAAKSPVVTVSLAKAGNHFFRIVAVLEGLFEKAMQNERSCASKDRID